MPPKNQPVMTVDELINKIKGDDVNVRFDAWRAAGPLGANAVEPLADLINNENKGVARAASEALQRITHHAARPGVSGRDKQAVIDKLLAVAASQRATAARVAALECLGFIGDGRTVALLARLLEDAEVREEARMAIERIPGRQSVRALEAALRRAPADFKPNLQQSLHNRRLTSATVGTLPAR